MTLPSSHEVTQLLKAWSAGDEQALERLTPLVCEQLHRVAQRYMADQRSDHTLQTTALVNEVYLRLVDCEQVRWQDRAHFFCHIGPVDAAHSDRFCALPWISETRRRHTSHVLGGSAVNMLRTRRQPSGTGRCVEGTCRRR